MPDLSSGQYQPINVGAAPVIPIESTAPAIAALQNAFQTGAVTFDTIYDHFNKGARDAVERQTLKEKKAQSEANMELIPVRSEAEKQDLIKRIRIAPLEAENLAGKLAADTSQIPIAAANTATRNQIESGVLGGTLGRIGTVNKTLDAQAKAGLELAKGAAEAAPFTATSQAGKAMLSSVEDVDLTDAYKQSVDGGGTGLFTSAKSLKELLPGSPLPRKDDGTLDEEAILDASKNLTALRLALVGQKDVTPVQKSLLDEAIRKRAVEEMFDPSTGMLLPASKMAETLKKVSEPPDSKQDLVALEGVRAVDKALPLLDMALSYISDKNTTPVGGGITEGSEVNQKLIQLARLMGLKTEKYRQQNELEMAVSRGVLDTIRSFAGTGVGRIMQSEVALMERAQPKVNSDAATWKAWIDRAREHLVQVRQDRVSQLSLDARKEFGISDSPETKPGTAPAPSKTPPPGVRATPVSSWGDFYRLSPGSWAVDPTGEYKYRP